MIQGPLLWAPLSEVWGRRRLFIISYLLFTCFNAGLVGSQDLPTVIILRFFSGCAGVSITHSYPTSVVLIQGMQSSPLTNAGGTVSDVFDAKMRGVGMAVFSCAPFVGPALGPIIGGFLGETAGFRWVFALVAILTGLLTFIGILFIPETYAPVLLRERASRLHEATGMVYRSVYEKDKRVVISELFRTSLSRPWKVCKIFIERSRLIDTLPAPLPRTNRAALVNLHVHHLWVRPLLSLWLC
jgi:MFS family permease